MNDLTVTRIEATNNKVIVQFRCSGPIKLFLKKNAFFAEYDTSISNLPESLLIIPFLGTICPVAWATQTEIHLKEIDRMYLYSLANIKTTLQKFYPRVKWKGEIHAGNIVDPPVDSYSRSMMLFSGGIDSITTFIRHQKEDPILVCVHGADVDVVDDEAWNGVVLNARAFSVASGSELRIIKSNMRALLDESKLRRFYGQAVGGWWESVMHGLALLSLCAPIAFKEEVGHLYIAGSLTNQTLKPWGSHPDLDNNVKWSGTSVMHDGCELSRQEKINLIASYMRNCNSSLVIRCCWESVDGGNCSKCEKCGRTIVGLEIAGLNPNKHGFYVDSATFELIKSNLANGNWLHNEVVRDMWKDLQHHARSRPHLPHRDANALIEWLATASLENLKPSQDAVGSRFPAKLVVFYRSLPKRITIFVEKALDVCLRR